MKTVFTNSQVAHVFAQQNQPHGRNAEKTFYFEGNILYSYGSHFKAAAIHTVKGQRFALVNSHNYSPSTSKHLHAARDAVRGLMPYFSAFDVTDLNKTAIDLETDIQCAIDFALAKKKVESRDSIGWATDHIQTQLNNCNEFRAILGKKALKLDAKKMKAVQAHLEARLARFQELNTPAEIERRATEKQARLARKYEKDIADFRNGARAYSLRDLPFELLRIEGDEVITSRGAEVPLTAAKQLHQAIKAGLDVVGKTVGSFTVESLTPFMASKDIVVKIGCHKILLSEANQVLGAA